MNTSTDEITVNFIVINNVEDSHGIGETLEEAYKDCYDNSRNLSFEDLAFFKVEKIKVIQKLIIEEPLNEN